MPLQWKDQKPGFDPGNFCQAGHCIGPSQTGDGQPPLRKVTVGIGIWNRIEEISPSGILEG